MLDLASLKETNDQATAQSHIRDCKNEMVEAVRRGRWDKATQLVVQIDRYKRFINGSLKRFPEKNAPTKRRVSKATRAASARNIMRRRAHKNVVPSWAS